MKHLEKCQAGVRLYIWPSTRMKDINWSQSLPPSPGKRQIILLSLAIFCIAQIWRATYFTSFDLKRSDVGHKKGCLEIRKRTFHQTCENEKREEINLLDTLLPARAYIHTWTAVHVSNLILKGWWYLHFSLLMFFHLDSQVSDFEFPY